MVTGNYSLWPLAFPKKPSVKAKHSALKTEFRPASKTQAVKLSKTSCPLITVSYPPS